ncbi:MAG: hypothetical protein ACHQPI_11555 [Thermoanaerobaculia bacterium]
MHDDLKAVWARYREISVQGPPWTPEERDLLNYFVRGRGRKWMEPNAVSILEQARAFGDLGERSEEAHALREFPFLNAVGEDA